MSLCYDCITTKYANVSVKFPEELDRELERFLDETGVYTNKSEFIKEAVRRHLVELNDEPVISALRIEQLLARAEQDWTSDEELQFDHREREPTTLTNDAELAASTPNEGNLPEISIEHVPQ